MYQSLDVGHDATKAAGLGWVRIDLNWDQCEPAPGAYDFALLDGVVDATSCGTSPTWSRSCGARRR